MWQATARNTIKPRDQIACLGLALQASGWALRLLRYGIWNLRHVRLEFGHAQPGNQGYLLEKSCVRGN